MNIVVIFLISIFLIPFILWWWNFLRKQADELGIIKLASKLFYYAESKLLKHNTK